MTGLRVLILGGTTFLGPYLIEALSSQRHTITIFTRGKTTTAVPSDVEQLYGDRNGDIEALKNRTWDIVIDTSCSIPSQAQASSLLLSKNVSLYVFISTVGVYENFHTFNIEETFPVAKRENEKTEELSEKTYGALKAASEKIILAHFPDRSLIIRPGLIVGPKDPTQRFSYWPKRIFKGGTILVPNVPNQSVQYIDVRDLAAWIVHMAEKNESGIYNTTGNPVSFKTFIEQCQGAVRSDHQLTWVDEVFLLKNNVQDWADLPLWLSSTRNMPGFLHVSIEKALKKGLVLRPIEETIQAVLDENLLQNFGLSEEREKALLNLWKK